MKTLRQTGRCDDAIQRARREAIAAFGDGTLYVERLVEHPRHVEIQVFADTHGNVVHLFERECSVQRRHQKTIEESPCVVADARAARSEWAKRPWPRPAPRTTSTRARSSFCSKATGDDAQFYFLEMNTRLQVEHPVTEAVSVSIWCRRSCASRRESRCRGAKRIYGSADTPSSAACTPKIRNRTSCRRPGRCCAISSRAAQAFAWTADIRKATRFGLLRSADRQDDRVCRNSRRRNRSRA